MVAVPTRKAPLFSATVTCTEPLPFSGPTAATVSHGVWLDELHAHPAGAMTAIAATPPALPAPSCSGAMAKLHAADWVTVNVCPPMIKAPVRAAPACAAALKATVAVPLPLAGDVMVSHGARLEAEQGHSAVVVRTTVPVPPAAGTACPG